MSYRDELPENKIDCPICGEIVDLDDFNFCEDMCINCWNESDNKPEINEELEAASDLANWVQKQNIS